ncbi:flippase [Collimonas fungivorans]|uniref:Membrane protein involved in the export of O-antigen and teichoic acid n=1 Tax=Collimonas fungivorans (strain Ter331) TaxID=1005048 RepID=G0AI61_COLFT|nr:flippase [Collimonas fungivorans]AEK60644.1 Membrane protein involved in the export of O-antigen and teichoic acid [Collimonas fungivorans Ter331]
MDLTNSESNKKSYRTFIHNIGWNLVGQVAPLIAAVVSIPLLIKGLGVDRFGILTIAWMLIGYFSLFDLGIGRALTQIISEKLAINDEAAIPPLMWTGLTVMFVLGLLASLFIVGLSDWIIYSALKIPVYLQAETKRSLSMLAPSIPLVLIATGLRGILEAKHEFKSVNLVRIPLGVLMFVAPLCVLPFSNSLVAIFFSLLLVRAATAIAFVYLCHRSLDNFTEFTLSKAVIPELLKFGGWMTVSNIVSPIMVQMDRFVIGMMLSMAAVAYYATPYEMVTKLLVVPAAIAGVCFPQFAKLNAQKNIKDAMALYWKSCKYIFYLTFPAIIFLVLFAGWILHLWLGGKFSDESTRVFQILAIGVLVNGLAAIPFAFLQGAGRSDVTAKVHVCELLVYLPLLYFAVSKFGIVGAATIWSLRVFCDGVILHKMVNIIIARGNELVRPSSSL